MIPAAIAPPPNPFLVAADLINPQTHPQLHDPVGWVAERLGESIWSQQRRVLTALDEHRRVAVEACHSSGKSFIAARAAAWWLDTHTPGDAFVVTTAPRGDQVKAILWREIGRAHRKGNLSGRVNLTEWYLDFGGGEELVAMGRKPSDYESQSFQGIHAQYVLVIIDEADGVPATLWEQIDTLASNEYAKILAIGNPIDPTSQFAAAVKLPGDLEPESEQAHEYESASGWHVIRIDAYRTPNFTGERVPEIVSRSLVSPVWVTEMERKHGAGSAWFTSRVRGRHPLDTEDGVIRGSKIRACRHLDADGNPIPAEKLWDPAQLLPVELGVDVGAGGDESVVRERRGVRAGRVWRQRSPDTMDLVDLVLEAIQTTGATRVKIDTIGIGKGTGDRLNQMRKQGLHRAVIVPVNVGERAFDPEQYVRLRDQIWWEVGRGLIEDGAIDLSELDEETISQLTAPRVLPPDAANRIRVEPKDKTRERIGRSPDDADAYLLSFLAIPVRHEEGYVVHDQRVTVSRF